MENEFGNNCEHEHDLEKGKEVEGVQRSRLFDKLEVRNIAAFAHEPTKYPKSFKQIKH